jgi:HAD superfamily hydrolase (TIGR01509 family)
MNEKHFLQDKLKCVIFDMDGLLVDTEKLRFISYRNSFKHFKINFKEDDYSTFWVKNGSGLSGYCKENDIACTLKEEIKISKEKYFLKLLNKVNLTCFAGVLEFLNILSNYNIKITLATSSSKDEAVAILKKVNVFHYFNFIATKDDVLNPKPSTDIYKFILNNLDLKSEDCIVLEDSLKGIIPSKRLNIKTIAIPNKYTKNEDFSSADLVLGSMKELNTEVLKGFFICE